jgi:hypothetical protein
MASTIEINMGASDDSMASTIEMNMDVSDDSMYFRLSDISRHNDGGIIIYDSRDPCISSQLELFDMIDTSRKFLDKLVEHVSIIYIGTESTCLLTLSRTLSAIKISTLLDSLPPSFRCYRMAISFSSPAVPA